MQNAGDFTFDNLTGQYKNKYLVYAEGIYVGVSGVEHHDDLAELAGVFDHVEGVDLLLVEGQLGHARGAFLPVALEAVVQVALLAATPWIWAGWRTTAWTPVCGSATPATTA